MENQATATEEAQGEELPTDQAADVTEADASSEAAEAATAETATEETPVEAAVVGEAVEVEATEPAPTEGQDEETAAEVDSEVPEVEAFDTEQVTEEPTAVEEPTVAAEADAEEGATEEAEAEAAAPVAEAEAEAEAEGSAAEEAEAEAEAEAEESVGDEDEEDEAAPVSLEPLSPYDLPGDWYVIHSYSGYENKVKANLETRVHSMHMESNIFDVIIPMEDVVEIKGGKKVTVPKKVFPGYILVRMYMDDDAWFTVRNTPGVTGFVGSPTKPTPLSRREVERILGVRKEEEAKAAPRFKPAWDVGEQVRVVDGPFADFNGIIEEINLDQSKVRVLVNIFGRETPVELNFEQIIKI